MARPEGGSVFEQPTHIYLNPVASERAEEFERFVVEVVVPAIRSVRPDLEGRWHLLKPVEPDPSDASICTYAFVFDGGSLEDDWELDKLLPAHYGAEAAGRLMSAWAETFVPLSRWLSSLGGDDAATPQVGWTFSTLH
jgi:hypothetical protein